MPEEESTDAAFGANLTETFTPLFQRVSITGEEDTGGVSSIDYNRSTTRSSLSVFELFDPFCYVSLFVIVLWEYIVPKKKVILK